MVNPMVRQLYQVNVARQKNEGTARRQVAIGAGAEDGHGSTKDQGNIITNKYINEASSSRELMIQVDQKKEAVLLPMRGVLVPVDVANVESVKSQQEGSHCYVHINFKVPVVGFGSDEIMSQIFSGCFEKEASFGSRDVQHATQIVQLINTVKGRVTERELEAEAQADLDLSTLVPQELLVPLKGTANIRLSGLWIRPAFSGEGRRTSGSLQVHSNGFRYATMIRNERVDIMFRNINRAFFQPAEKEGITFLHFQLYNFIIVGNERTKDVQFYMELEEVVQAFGGIRLGQGEPEKNEDEQHERDGRKRIIEEFKFFVKYTSRIWKPGWKRHPWQDLDMAFGPPLWELKFHGLSNESFSFIAPTVDSGELEKFLGSMMSLTDTEIVNLERVGTGLRQKDFDMAIVFGGVKKEVIRIDAIPTTSLGGIRKLLNCMGIEHFESRMNMNWRFILGKILDDPERFVEAGGWEILNIEDSDSDK